MLNLRRRLMSHRASFGVATTAAAFATLAAGAPLQAAECDDTTIAVLASPTVPWKGAPLRVIFSTETPFKGTLKLLAPDGSTADTSKVQLGGPPYFWTATISKPEAGTWRAVLERDGAPSNCRQVARNIPVAKSKPGSPRAVGGSIWPVRNAWSAATENIYSAWIEKLFDAPLDETLSWPALHEVLRDPARNLLHNHLGLKEDEQNLVIRPDCADLPYFLRGYFAFKLGLPFGYSSCSRGSGKSAPQCQAWRDIRSVAKTTASTPPPQSKPNGLFGGLFDEPQVQPARAEKTTTGNLVKDFGAFIRSSVANTVHSGSGRTRATDDRSDYYSVPLTAEALRPGTVYADPYGHLLVVVKRVAQTDDAAGIILAVDGQPDGTIARKRFWRGNFLFARDSKLGSAGFKRFRPVVDSGGKMRRLTNAQIKANPQYGDYSLDQTKIDVEEFYDRMDDVMSPQPLDPERALKEAIVSLDEQVNARITSVENGRKYQTGGGKTVSMPDGPSIFETTGAWEDFATPSRDLRLLIAIDVVRNFPDRVARRPNRYAMPSGQSPDAVKAQLETILASEAAARKFTYKRSDGSDWTLSLKDVIERAPGLEMAYNINDCVELRWGAGDGSTEAATCKRRASSAQRKKMAQYRPWFSERRRPARQ